MELLQLRYFYESAQNENFTKTAEKYQVPTTSVSASVKRLEKELGCQLFDRVSNRIQLNQNGRLLQRTLCAVFHELDSAVSALTAHAQDLRNIRILVRGMRRNVTALITQFKQLHPDISFTTVFDRESTEQQDYHIIIDEENDQYSGYEGFSLFNVRLRLKCQAGNPLSGKKLTLSELCTQSFVLMDISGNMNKILTKACNRVGFTPHISVLCNDIACYEKFIASGMGIGIGQQAEAAETSTDAIVDLDVADFHEHYTVNAYYKQSEYYGNVKAFVDFLKSKAI